MSKAVHWKSVIELIEFEALFVASPFHKAWLVNAIYDHCNITKHSATHLKLHAGFTAFRQMPIGHRALNNSEIWTELSLLI
jgi:hypothetical protein